MGTHARLIEALEELNDEELDDPSFFKNMPSDWTLWHLVAANTYQHYAEHAFTIRKTLRAFRSE